MGDRVLLWSTELATQEGNKVIKPWIGPFVVTARLGSVGYELKSEVGGRVARVHINRLRKISSEAIETGEPKDGVFPDALRILRKISGTDMRTDPSTGQPTRFFKVQIGGRNSPRWTPESDLPEGVGNLFNNQERQKDSNPTPQTLSHNSAVEESQ